MISTAPPVQRHPDLLGRAGERELLDQLLGDVRQGQSAVLVVRGEPGIGKTAVLRYAAREAAGFRIARIGGVEAEMELPLAAVHQLCAPLAHRLIALPDPQRRALSVVLGLSSGDPPDRFLLALSVFSLLSLVAEERPLLCLVDDAQWLDRASEQILGFVARRLLAEPVAIMLALREPSTRREFERLPDVCLGGLDDDDARALLARAMPGRIDDQVRDRIVAETRGNPLALLELPRGMSTAELAGGFELPATEDLPSHIERHYLRRVAELPEATQRLMLLAAADPVGDAALVWRAAQTLAIGAGAVAPAEDAGLLEIGAWVRFRHPLVRSAVYRAASPGDRRRAHEALADASDRDIDTDRRAWHRALAAAGPDDGVAAELEHSAGRAQTRGGLAAAAAFLERATMLTEDPAKRGARALDAAQAKFEAGARDMSLELLATAEHSPLDPLQRARLERQRAQIAFMSARGTEALHLLLDAARRLEPLDAELARATYLDAFSASVYAGRAAGGGAMREVAEAARAVRRDADPPAASDLLIDGLALRFTAGYVAAVSPLQRALRRLTRERQDQDIDLRLWLVSQVAHEVWDDEAWYWWADRAAEAARDRGALTALPALLDAQAATRLHAGRFDDAAALIGEADAIYDATGLRPVRYVPLVLAAWRGDEAAVTADIQAKFDDAAENGEGLAISVAECASALLNNGAGRHEAALASARRACEYEDLGQFHWSLAEVIEAAVRSGSRDVAESACRDLEERAAAANTPWSLGIKARSRALLTDGDEAEGLYRESLKQLARCGIAVQLARTQLLYGEWLRRESRRVDARTQLRAAHDFFDRIGAAGFAGRARNELKATGETARKRRAETRDELTPQERQIAQLARDGLSNPEIGARLFLSPRTVEWHLRKVFSKVGIRSRRELGMALPAHEAGGNSVAAGRVARST
jgi:DNA-binding CsgD family transcriptional regulator